MFSSVAVTRSKDVPAFGPPIPEAAWHRSTEFADFLLAKIINAENASHQSEKFQAMAVRTRREYMKDLATNYVTGNAIDITSKLGKMSSCPFSLLVLIPRQSLWNVRVI